MNKASNKLRRLKINLDHCYEYMTFEGSENTLNDNELIVKHDLG